MDGQEFLDQEAMDLEQVYLGLRTLEGVRPQLLQPAQAELWQSAGWAVVGADRVTLTPEGWLRLDALAASAVTV
jgi:hypothetical protein